MSDEQETIGLFDAYSSLHNSHVQPPGGSAPSVATVELQATVESASFSVKLAELLDLAPGVIIRGFSPTATLALKLDGERVAEVELCLVDNSFALRVLDVHQSMIPNNQANNQLACLIDEGDSEKSPSEMGRATS